MLLLSRLRIFLQALGPGFISNVFFLFWPLAVQCSSTISCKDSPSSIELLCQPCHKSVGYIWIDLFQAPVLFLWFMRLSVHKYHLSWSLQLHCNIGAIIIPPTLLFFFKTLFSSPGLLHFHINCRINFSVSTKSLVRILIRIALYIQINFWRIKVFTMLSPLIFEHRTSPFI